jgi:hypothetical protein
VGAGWLAAENAVPLLQTFVALHIYSLFEPLYTLIKTCVFAVDP